MGGRGSLERGSVAMLGALVIDDKGETSPLGAARLRELMQCTQPDFDVIAYAVRNLGFVLLRRQGRVVRAEMRPALVKPATLIGLYYNLLDLRPERILLSRLTAEGATHELFDDMAEFAATIERSIDDEGIQRHRPAYAISQRPLQQLGRPRHTRLAQIVTMWRAKRGRLPADLVQQLRHYGLSGRVALLRNPPGTGRLVYDHIGSGYSFLDHACLPLMMIGADIEMLPDRDFGDWVADAYYRCLNDEKARLETISAVMRRSDGQRLWSYYDRVLLPWQADDGTRYVLGLSEVRRSTLAA
jgi:hypothetical protein